MSKRIRDMKVDLIRKFKWYIVGFILVAIMLSVSLSFCAWDTLSFKAIMNANGGDFTEKPDTKYELGTLPGDDKGTIGIADVGDIVTFGNYYQELTQTGEIAEKTPIRWRVVDITARQDGQQGKQLTLLAEKVMAFGSFWGTLYHNGSTTLYGTRANGTHYQNYSQSTVRAWLNSVKDDSGNPTIIRNDGGPEIASNKSPSGVQFKGFMSEAFTADEQTYILPKTISGIKGDGIDGTGGAEQPYGTVTDKVWLPSWSEVYGTTVTPWGTTQDGSPSARFSYFNSTNYAAGNAILNGYTTAFASSQYSNYTWTNATHAENYQGSAAGGNVWWWLRSPSPAYNFYSDSDSLFVNTGGGGKGTDTTYSFAGVRPAICLPL